MDEFLFENSADEERRVVKLLTWMQLTGDLRPMRVAGKGDEKSWWSKRGDEGKTICDLL